MTFSLTGLDVSVFVAFIATVIGIGLWQGRNQTQSSEGYFLAGRALPWWLIGISLIATNISTEQFVGMNGSAAGPTGLAIASYCWIASFGLVIVAFTFLPAFLRTGVYTVPEFLEYRYHPLARTIMAFVTVLVYVFINIAAVTYSGAILLTTLFHGERFLGCQIDMVMACWILGSIATVYVVVGGLKSCVWADLLQGGALIFGGLFVTSLAFSALGHASPTDLFAASANAMPVAPDTSGLSRFFELNREKLHLFLPTNDKVLPWTALVIGLWIPNFYYWGLNQYIVQRTLGARSLREGQKGIVLAAGIHLITPLFVVVAGLLAFNLYGGAMSKAASDDPAIHGANKATLALFETERSRQDSKTVFTADEGWRAANPSYVEEIDRHNEVVRVRNPESFHTAVLLGYKYDTAYGLLIRNLVPVGFRGFILAAILGAIVSSLGAMLNSASSIFTMDLFRKFFVRNASDRTLVITGRISAVACMVVSCLIAPHLAHPGFGGIFQFMQEYQGCISPGILATFVLGIVSWRVPPSAGIAAILLNPIVYLSLLFFTPEIAFLNRMAITFVVLIAVMLSLTAWRPLAMPRSLPKNLDIDLTHSRAAQFCGGIIIVCLVTLYIVFR